MDDFGQVTAITDQGGHTTTYGYDGIGRIAQISYPHDSRLDSASWYPKVFSYAYVTGAERGVAAGHWRRTVTQGNATDTTYFDAELRPVLHDTSNGSADISTGKGVRSSIVGGKGVRSSIVASEGKGARDSGYKMPGRGKGSGLAS